MAAERTSSLFGDFYRHWLSETTNAVWGTADTRVVGPSRFWVAGRRVPEPNADALKTAPAFQYLPHFFRDSSWTQQEHERLQRAILQAVYVCAIPVHWCWTFLTIKESHVMVHRSEHLF